MKTSFCKHVFFLAILAPFAAQAFVALEGREPLSVEDGRLTPYWAQEYVGADLAKEELQQINGLQPVPFSILDGGFEKKYLNLLHDIPVDGELDRGRKLRANHGTSVANIINGPGMVSVSELVDFVQLRKVSPGVFYTNAEEEIRNLATPPQIISNSMGWPGENVTQYAEEMDRKGIIWVLAAGNDHPAAINSYEQTPHVISVGSYSPRGLQTIYSQESSELDILAPADDYQASINGSGELSLFGATSGATPMVSGTVANLKALLPTLNRAEATVILKKTALRSFQSLYSQTNKAGLLNSYKAVRVAIVIRERCGNSAACVATEIKRDVNYHLSPLAMNPQIGHLCQDPKMILDAESMELLRKNFLLNPAQTQFANLLSCAYRNEGYSINADYYNTMALLYNRPSLLQQKVQKQAVAAILNDYTNSASLRDLQLLDESFKNALNTVIKTDKGIGKFNAENYLQRFQKTKRIQIP